MAWDANKLTKKQLELLGVTPKELRKTRLKLPKAGSLGEADFVLLAQANRLPDFKRNHKAVEDRRLEFDFAWPEYRVALEVQGLRRDGKGGHQRGKGFENDCFKVNWAALNGWLLLQATRAMISDPFVKQVVIPVLEGRGWKR